MDALLEPIKLHSSTVVGRDAREKIIQSLRKLADSMEEPIGTIHRFGHLELQKGTIQVGLDLRVFQALVKAKGAVHSDEVAQQTGADPALIKRLLRYYATINVVDEVSKSTYKANNLTRNLEDPCVKAALGHYYGIVDRQYSATADYLKEIGYRNPMDETDTAFHRGWKTNMKPFDWMVAHPEALDYFHTYMSLRRQTDMSWLSVYPVREEAMGLKDPDRALYVNIGGGIGHQCAEFREKYPDLVGRIILQDMQAVIAQALPTQGVENMAHNFFEPQPVKGAKFYFMRGVPHNHTPKNVKKILENIRSAMSRDSVLLVDETVLPETGVNFVAASIDLTMLGAFASMERTEEEWRSLMESAGLELVKVYNYNPTDNECVMDVRLPRLAT